MESIQEKDFQTDVLESDIPVVVTYGTLYCSKCRLLSAMFKQLEQDYEGKVSFVSVDVSAELGLAERYGIVALPVIQIWQSGAIYSRFDGVALKTVIADDLDSLLEY